MSRQDHGKALGMNTCDNIKESNQYFDRSALRETQRKVSKYYWNPTFFDFLLFLGGQFAFARQTSRQAKTSRLISSKVCGKKCVEFFYFMENFKNSEFKLSTRKDNKEDRVWFNSGGGIKFEDWTRGLVEINADDGTCQEVSNWLTLNYTKMFAEQTAYKENVCNRGLEGRARTSKGALPFSLVSCEIQWRSGL